MRSPRTYSPTPDYSPSPRRRRHYRSISPRDRKYRDRSYSRSPYASRSRSRSYSRSYSGSPGYSSFSHPSLLPSSSHPFRFFKRRYSEGLRSTDLNGLIRRTQSQTSKEDSEVYIFTEDYCAYVDYANDKILSGPVKIGEMFPVLKNTVFEDGIDSAFRSIKDKEVYLFKDNKYCCIAYDCREQLIGSIGNIGDGFPVLKGTIFESGIDACFASHEKGGVYFFKDVKYVHIKFTSDSYDDAIPGDVRNVLDGWPCLEGVLCIDGELVFDKIIVRECEVCP